MSDLTFLSGGLSVDDRGTVRFVNDFNPLSLGVRRFYQVENHCSRFIRAWHAHLKEAKYVYVAQGSALVGMVRINPDGSIIPDYQASTFVLSSKMPKVLYIPPCHANGFMTLEPDTIMMFFSTSTLCESKGDDIRFDYKCWDVWDIEPR